MSKKDFDALVAKAERKAEGDSNDAEIDALWDAVREAQSCIIDLDAPDTWDSSVWRAFERASHERTLRNINATDDRRHEGNKLVNEPVRVCPPDKQGLPFNDPARYDELTPQDYIRDHGIDVRPLQSGRRLFTGAHKWAEDDRLRTPPHGTERS